MAYRNRLRMVTLEQWRHDQVVWALLAPHTTKSKRKDPPGIPPILDSLVRSNGHR